MFKLVKQCSFALLEDGKRSREHLGASRMLIVSLFRGEANFLVVTAASFPFGKTLELSLTSLKR